MKKKQIFYSYLGAPLRLKSKVDSINATGQAFLKEVLDIDEPIYLTKQGAKRTSSNFHVLLEDSKQVKTLTSLSFRQMVKGVPVWDAGINVLISDDFEVCHASSSYRKELKDLAAMKDISAARFKEMTKKVDPNYIKSLMDFDRNVQRLKHHKVAPKEIKYVVNAINPWIYQYHEEERLHHHEEGEENSGFPELPHMRLPALQKSIKEEGYYPVLEILFTTHIQKGKVNWRMFVDIQSESVLYLRILSYNVNGLVYDDDPNSITGNTTITPASSVALLNTVRTPRPLPGLTPSNPQLLTGEYVQIIELLGPIIAAPTEILPNDFNYDADSDDFSAVNAYYHNDGLFRMVEEMGFNMNSYFDGLIADPGFPLPVDHRGALGMVNACVSGNFLGNGATSIKYGLIDAGQNIGIANCRRVALHEFGHVILLDHVSSGNYGFAHSAGDSLAAILLDPRSKHPDRFLTFPFVSAISSRRHDRDVSTTWAWGGTDDDGAYGSEQVLSTSHFRIYRSVGGDHPDLIEREFAARYISYLIIFGTGLLTPATNPNSPEEWVSYMQIADFLTSNFEGQPRGCVHKVIRWAFEKQGAFQLPGTPTPITSEGAPPNVDVYINDGRNGEYQFSQDIYDSNDVWNRHASDAGPTNQKPIVGQINYAYAIVRNRGTQTANGVRVRAFRSNHCCCSTNDLEKLEWPKHFNATHTPILGGYTIPSESYVLVGPFAWMPESDKEELLFAVDARGDNANINYIPSGESVALNHLVPLDNNLILRRFY